MGKALEPNASHGNGWRGTRRSERSCQTLDVYTTLPSHSRLPPAPAEGAPWLLTSAIFKNSSCYHRHSGNGAGDG